jgi:hypothetical protein
MQDRYSQSENTPAVAGCCAPETMMPPSTSRTTPACRVGSLCRWAGLERSICGGTIA